MTVYEVVKNFTVEDMAELLTSIAIKSAKSALSNSPSYLIDAVESTRESLREDYIRLLNSEMPGTEGEKYPGTEGEK